MVGLITEAGQVIGDRLRGGLDSTLIDGADAWFFDGSTTRRIGLYDTEHSFAGSVQYNSSRLMNAAGHVVGHATRFHEDFGPNGTSVWYFDGIDTIRIGLTGDKYTGAYGEQYNMADHLNAAGQVTGFAYRGGAYAKGSSAWFYDPATNMTYDLGSTFASLSGYAESSVRFLSDDGLVLGEYLLFDDTGRNLGKRAFGFTLADGWRDLGSLVEGGLDAAGWELLSSAQLGNGRGQIVGIGRLAGVPGESAYLLTPVPEPGRWAMMLAGVVLLAGVAARRRRARSSYIRQ